MLYTTPVVYYTAAMLMSDRVRRLPHQWA